MPQHARDRVFISYSHKDKPWREDLEKHLKPHMRVGSIESWSDEQIRPGSQWFEEIKSALADTKAAVLLVTPDFLDSDFIHEHELGPLLKEAEQGGLKILWVPVRASAYKTTALKDYQAVFDPDKPLANMKVAKRDQAWVRICEEIEKTCKPSIGSSLEAAPAAAGFKAASFNAEHGALLHQIPPPPVAFTGRVAEIDKLLARIETAMLHRGGTGVVEGLQGLSGAGKTALVLALAVRLRDRFPDGQLFLDLNGYKPQCDPLKQSTPSQGTKPTNTRTITRRSIGRESRISREIISGGGSLETSPWNSSKQLWRGCSLPMKCPVLSISPSSKS